MKKLLPFLAVLLLASCEMRFLDSVFDAMFHDSSFHFTYPQRFNNQVDVASFVASNVNFERDENTHGVPDYWQTPEETLASGRGDCEDSVILFLALNESAFGKRGALVGVVGPGGPHAVALVDGIVYDVGNVLAAPVSEYPFQQVVGVFTYEQAMFKAYTTH